MVHSTIAEGFTPDESDESSDIGFVTSKSSTQPTVLDLRRADEALKYLSNRKTTRYFALCRGEEPTAACVQMGNGGLVFTMDGDALSEPDKVEVYARVLLRLPPQEINRQTAPLVQPPWFVLPIAHRFIYIRELLADALLFNPLVGFICRDVPNHFTLPQFIIVNRNLWVGIGLAPVDSRGYDVQGMVAAEGFWRIAPQYVADALAAMSLASSISQLGFTVGTPPTVVVTRSMLACQGDLHITAAYRTRWSEAESEDLLACHGGSGYYHTYAVKRRALIQAIEENAGSLGVETSGSELIINGKSISDGVVAAGGLDNMQMHMDIKYQPPEAFVGRNTVPTFLKLVGPPRANDIVLVEPVLRPSLHREAYEAGFLGLRFEYHNLTMTLWADTLPVDQLLQYGGNNA